MRQIDAVCPACGVTVTLKPDEILLAVPAQADTTPQDVQPYIIDGREVGGTPVVEYGVAPGRHTIRVERPGYKTKSEVVNVGAGETVRKRWTLEEGTD